MGLLFFLFVMLIVFPLALGKIMIDQIGIVLLVIVFLAALFVGLVKNAKATLIALAVLVLAACVAVFAGKAVKPSSDHSEHTKPTAQQGYELQVAVSNISPAAGDAVSLTALVTYNGEPVEDLESAGLYLWWWTDVWAEGHSDGLLDAIYSDSSGLSLTNDVTLPSAGTYYICVELKDGDENLFEKAFLTFTTTSSN